MGSNLFRSGFRPLLSGLPVYRQRLKNSRKSSLKISQRSPILAYS